MDDVMQAFAGADGKTLAVFDIDMVLVQPADPHFQMANMQQHREIVRRIMHSLSEEKQYVFLSLINVSSPSLLIDEATPESIRTLQERGIPAMALTANVTGSLADIPCMEEWKIARLRGLGIDFSCASPFPGSLVLRTLAPYRGNYSVYREGVLFANGPVDKGRALVDFLKKIALMPEKVVFVDDREANLKSVKEALYRFDSSIEYEGLHFVGASHYPSSPVSREAFEARWQKVAAQTERAT